MRQFSKRKKLLNFLFLKFMSLPMKVALLHLENVK